MNDKTCKLDEYCDLKDAIGDLLHQAKGKFDIDTINELILEIAIQYTFFSNKTTEEARLFISRMTEKEVAWNLRLLKNMIEGDRE